MWRSGESQSTSRFFRSTLILLALLVSYYYSPNLLSDASLVYGQLCFDIQAQSKTESQIRLVGSTYKSASEKVKLQQNYLK